MLIVCRLNISPSVDCVIKIHYIHETKIMWNFTLFGICQSLELPELSEPQFPAISNGLVTVFYGIYRYSITFKLTISDIISCACAKCGSPTH